MAIQIKKDTTRRGTRWLAVGLLIVTAFIASFAFAQLRSGAAVASTALYTQPQPAVAGSTAAGGAGGGCCGGAGAASGGTASAGGGCCGGGAPAGSAKTAKATLSGGVQTIKVDLSKGYYDPSTIQLKAGVPAEITFGQSSGCTGLVQSADLGFSEDLSTGAKTVKLPALKAGTYGFACGMNMVTGSIVVN